ncbi:MAG: hypothetical protein Q8P60_11750 [Pseudorhodobacter sp.]|nr:hypothetical protein [Pseudorhodobacter sp.]
MQFLVPIGAAMSLAGVAGLIWCILLAVKARRAGLSDADMRARLQRVVVLNMAALGVSALGLMLVVIGILLG